MPQGLNLHSGAGWAAGGNTLADILAQNFRQAAATREAQLRENQLAQEQRQFDAMQPFRERGMAVDEGNLGLRRNEFDAQLAGGQAATTAAEQKQIQIENIISALPPEQQNAARAKLIGLDVNSLTPPDPNAIQQRLIDLQNLQQTGRIALEQERGRQDRLTLGAKPPTGAGKTQDPSTANKMLDDAIATVDRLKTMPGMAGAVGAKGPSSLFGLMNKPIAGTNAANYRAYVETLKGQLTLPNMQLMRGMGAMSDRDLAVIQSAMTALSTDLSEDQFMTELGNIERTLAAARARMQGGGVLPPQMPSGRASGAGPMNVPGAPLPSGYRKVGG